MHKLCQSVRGYIRKHDLLRPGDRVGVAVSGGADSVALLRILLELRRELGIVLSVVHLNHKLRGPESDADEQFVRELAAARELHFIAESADVKQHAAQLKLSLETAARDLRYRFFHQALANESLDKIATGHTLDDQAETVLLKLVRGAGTRGLAGVYAKLSNQHLDSAQHSALSIQPGKAIVRPLLGTRRSEIEAYLRDIGQGWREDSSNRELRHTRNRIRHEILPKLEQLVNTQVRESLAEAADIARAEQEFWEEKIASLLPQVCSRSEGEVRLNTRELKKLGLAIQRRIVRAAAESLCLNLEFHHVEEVLTLSSESSRASLPKGWAATLHNGEIRFQRNSRDPIDYEYSLQVPGQIRLAEAGLLIDASFISKSDPLNEDRLIDGNYLSNALVVRNWRAGDRFWPKHAKAPKKLKELLQDMHITGEGKKMWPVIASGSEVIWVRGLGVHRSFQSKNGEGVLIRDSPLNDPPDGNIDSRSPIRT